MRDEKNAVRPLTETVKGKTIGWRTVVGSGLMEFAFVEGGELPKALKGRWTSIRDMKALAESYVEQKGIEKKPTQVASNA